MYEKYQMKLLLQQGIGKLFVKYHRAQRVPRNEDQRWFGGIAGGLCVYVGTIAGLDEFRGDRGRHF